MASASPSMPPALAAAELTQMLNSILNLVDNNERRAVEAQVVSSLHNPENLIQLVTILCSGDGQGANGTGVSTGVRQLAAVLLRKKVFSLWHALPTAQQHELRGLLLQQLGVEPARMVRLAIAHIVTRLAKADDSDAGWPELHQAVRAAVEDPRPDMRELAMVLVYSFAEVFSDAPAELASLAAESVVRGMQDTEPVVLAAAIKASEMLIPAVAPHASVFRALVQHIVPQALLLLKQLCMDESKASLCVNLLDLLEQLIEGLSVKRYGDLLTALGNDVMSVLALKAASLRVRQSAAVTLGTFASLKPKFIVSSGLLPQMVNACLTVMAEDATISLPDTNQGLDQDNQDDLNGDDDDDDEMLDVRAPCMIGGELLSALGAAVPSKAFTGAVLPFCAVLEQPQSGDQDALQRKAAMVALACVAESNPSYLRRRVGYVLEVTERQLRDAHAVPREAGAFALSYFCSHLQPEILTHHSTLFPLLTPLLQDENDLVRRRVAAALDTLCENVQENLEPYVDGLLPLVMGAIGNSSMDTQSALCGVIASMAMTACPSFLSHAPAVLELLRQPFTLNTPATLPLRARATETVGVVGAAMGKDAFSPYFPFFMEQVVTNFSSKHASLREESFGFLANVCQILKEDFAPYLNDSIVCALQTIEEDRAVYKNKHLLAASNMPVLDDAVGGGGEADNTQGERAAPDSEDEAEEIHLRVRTADVEEKAAAVYCIGVFADVLLNQFGSQRIEHCYGSLQSMDEHFYPNIRANAMLAMAKLVKASAGVPSSEAIRKSQNEDTLPEPTRDLLEDLIHVTLFSSLRKDSEKEVVSATCEAISLLMDFYGPQVFPYGPLDLVKLLIQVFRQKLPCQVNEDNDVDENGHTFDPEDSDDEYNKQNGFGLGGDANDPAAPFLQTDEQSYMGEVMKAFQAGVAPPPMPGGASGEDPAASTQQWLSSVTPDLFVQNVRLAEDHDEQVMEAASELLESTAKAYGPSFHPFLRVLFPLLKLYADPSRRPPEDLVMSVGTMALTLQALGRAAAEYLDECMAVSFAVLEQSDESSARANCCFLVRVLVEQCGTTRFADPASLQQTLQALWSVASSTDEVPQAVDNAVSATCSLIRCVPSSLIIPMLPSAAPALLDLLPMRIDKDENANAMHTLHYLTSDTTMAPRTAEAAWLPNLVAAVARVLASHTVTTELKRELVQTGLTTFVGACSEKWAAARSKVSPEEKTTLAAYNL